MDPFSGLFTSSAKPTTSSDPFAGAFAGHTPLVKTVNIAKQSEQQILRQQQLAKGINNPSTLVKLQAQLRTKQITPQQFMQQFPKASLAKGGADANGDRAPVPFKITPGVIAKSTGTAAKQLGINLAKGLTQSEKTTATGVARVLPGGLSDVNANEQQAQEANKIVKQAISDKKSGKINPITANNIIQMAAFNASDASSQQAQTIKSLPSRGQLAAGFGGTAADILTAGTLPEIKGAGTAARVVRAATTPVAFGTASGLNAGAGGGTKKQIAENALSGAAFPIALHVAGKGIEAAGVVSGKDRAVNNLIKNTKTTQVLDKTSKTSDETPIVKPTSVNDITPPKLSPKSDGAPGVSESTKPKLTKLVDESGSIPVGKVVDLIEKHQQSTKFSGDLQKGNDQLEGSKAVIAEDTGKAIDQRAPISNGDKQLLQSYRDQKAAGLTPNALPAHLQPEDADVTALNKATQAHDAELARLNDQEQKAQTIENRDASTYTHREAQGKGSSLDYLNQGDRKNPLSVGGFGKTTPGSKARTFMAVTDETGNRRVVAVKNSVLKDGQGRKIAQGKLVQAIDDGGKTRENLGKLKLKTNQDFLDKELSPYQTKVKNLQKEYDTLSKVKIKGGVSEARIDALAKKAALLEDPGNLSTITKTEARSLQQAKTKLRELTKVKPTGTNAPRRLQTINQHLMGMNNEIEGIRSTYDPETLDKKVFVGKDGKKYTIGQATTDEITKATGQKYYTDPKLMALKNYADSRTALENARFIESIKKHPDFETFASEPGKTAPKGWKGVTGLDQFRGYKFDPKIREVLIDLVKSGSDERSISQDVSQVLRQAIVYFPLKHSINEGFTYAVDRGLSSYANPAAYKRGAQALVKAFHDVTNQSETFQAAQKAGMHMTTGGDKVLSKSFEKALKELSPEHPAIIDTAKQWGTSPIRLYKAVQNLTVWELQDVLNMARINERMAPKIFSKGESLENAVEHTKRYNLQYQVPSRVGPKILPGRIQRGLSRGLRSPAIFFGRYKYDQVRILSNIIKDTVNLKSLVKNPKQNVQAVDKLAALAIGTAIVWPLVDKGVQKLSGDKNAHVTAPGVGGLVEAGTKVATGQEGAGQAISSQISIATPVTLGLDIKNNINSFTGKPIADPNASETQQAEQRLKYIESQLSPLQKFSQGKSNAPNKVVGVILSMAGASLPKNSSADTKLASYQYDTQPMIQAYAKQQAAKGDVKGAIDTITKYNNEVTTAARAAAKADGTSMPTSAQLKKAGVYYDPSLSTVQGWQKTAAAKPGTLQSILNTKVVPTKGQPGYKQYEKAKAQQAKITKAYNKSHPAGLKPVTALP